VEHAGEYGLGVDGEMTSRGGGDRSLFKLIEGSGAEAATRATFHNEAGPQSMGGDGVSVPDNDTPSTCACHSNVGATSVIKEANLTTRVGADQGEDNELLFTPLEGINGADV
jgi:hypothetical protein